MNIRDIIGLQRMLVTADARMKIASKTDKTNQRAKQLRDGYAASKFKQRQYTRNIARTKHK